MVFLIFAVFLYKSFCVNEVYVWPYPKSVSVGKDTISFSSVSYTLYDISTGKYIKIEDDIFVSNLVSRYQNIIFPEASYPNLKENHQENQLEVLVSLRVKDVNKRDLDFETIDSYQINITTTDVTIYGDTIFGLLRGIETFSQLCEYHSDLKTNHISNTPITITDSPRYSWRGLLLDISRHYIKIDVIKKIVDGMSYNKLNVLHLHMTDSHSFPFESKSFPLLSEKGSYNPKKAIYTSSVLKELKEYCYYRGIRVIPEFDIPGHSYSIGKGYPEIVADCPLFKSNINGYMLNHVNEKTNEIVKGVISDMNDIFTDPFIHLGGDELNYACWEDDVTINEYMVKNNVTGQQLAAIFMNDILSFAIEKEEKKIITWQEIVRELKNTKYPIPQETYVHVWKKLKDLAEFSETGKYIINSAGWYFDVMSPVPPLFHWFALDVWEDMYAVELEDYVKEEHVDQLIGGEGAMWGEQVNDNVVVQRIFPKLLAVSERLWSPKEINIINGKLLIEDVQDRISNQICSLNRRGVNCSPIRPGYCEIY